MIDADRAKQLFKSRQADYFRVAKLRDIDCRRLALLSGIPFSTLTTWASGQTSMPAWALFELAQFIDDDLNCMLVERSGKFIGTCEPGDETLDALGRETAAFTYELLQAHDPDGPGGTTITPIEEARLKQRARRVACKGRAAAA